MERDEALKIIRSIEWPSEVAIYAIDAVIKGDLIGFANAKALERDGMAAWEPAGAKMMDSMVLFYDGEVRRGRGVLVPFERIERIEVI